MDFISFHQKQKKRLGEVLVKDMPRERKLADYFKAVGLTVNIKKDEKILDIGCGYGSALHEIAELVGPKGTVVGADVCEKTLKQTKLRLDATKGRILLYHTDAEKLPKCSDNYFNRIFAVGSFTYVGDKIRALEETMRVLKRNGCLYMGGLALILRVYDRVDAGFLDSLQKKLFETTEPPLDQLDEHLAGVRYDHQTLFSLANQMNNTECIGNDGAFKIRKTGKSCFKEKPSFLSFLILPTKTKESTNYDVISVYCQQKVNTLANEQKE